MSSYTPRILVIDDEASVASSIERYFRAMDFEVNATFSAEDGMRLLERLPADIVITDIKMPGMSGLDLLKAVKDNLPGTDVIIMSGHGDIDDAIEALRRGAYDYLCKPFDYDELAITVRHALEKRAAEQKIREIREQLYHAQKMDSLGLLAGGVAHEFNNLMSGILGYSDMALASDDQDLKNKALGICLKSSRRAAEIARNLLRFAQHDNCVRQPVDLNALVSDTVSLIHKDMEHSRVRCNCELAPVPLVDGDAGQLRQVLLNLLVNAKQALLQKHEDNRAVIINSWHDGQQVFLSVQDNGPGVPDEFKSRIFEPFFTTLGVLRQGSSNSATGLGLSVVDGIVRGHGGEVKVEDAPGGGARFNVSFPALKNAEKRRKRILVCDDESSIRRITRAILEKADYEVEEAETGEEALQTLRRADFDLLLLDQLMPGISGIEVIKKALEYLPRLPIVMVTAVARHEFAREAVLAGARECIFKPTNTRKLLFIAEKYARPAGRIGANVPLPVQVSAEEKSVLVVDPDMVLRDIYNLTLTREGYRTSCAGTGREALEMTADHYFDLIIVDPEIFDVSGNVVMQSLRANNPYTPILLSTCHIDDATVERGLKAGACRVIEKPFHPKDLLETIANIIAIYHSANRPE